MYKNYQFSLKGQYYYNFVLTNALLDLESYLKSQVRKFILAIFKNIVLKGLYSTSCHQQHQSFVQLNTTNQKYFDKKYLSKLKNLLFSSLQLKKKYRRLINKNQFIFLSLIRFFCVFVRKLRWNYLFFKINLKF